MKSILRSVKPYWFYLICEGKKKIEVCKTEPLSKEWDRIVYLYCSKDMRSFNRIPEEYHEKYRKYLGTVGAKLVCCEVEKFNVGSLRSDDIEELACLSYAELINYFYKPCELDGKTAKQGYAWHISDLKIYDNPRELGELRTPDKPYHEIIERDGSLMFMDGYESGKPLKRTPQSWQYVEEVEEK